MKHPLVGGGFMGGMLLGVCVALSAPAQDATVRPDSPAVTKSPQNGQTDKGKPLATPTSKHAPLINDVVNMLQAGVSSEVLKSYIENWPVPFALNASDIIELKGHAVPDDITTALVKRGAVLREQAVNVKLQRQTEGNSENHMLDPEGYDYFQYYYLYPRTLAAANQRFYSQTPSSYGYSSYSYGDVPVPFSPLPPSGSRRR